MNEITMSAPDINEVVTIGGEEYMRYKPIPLDYCIIRGTYVDEYGNLTTDEEAMQLEVFSAVMACKKFGGKVLAQAKYKVRAGSLHCKRVIVPGVFIDAVVICPNPEEDHRQTHSFYMDPAYWRYQGACIIRRRPPHLAAQGYRAQGIDGAGAR